MRLKELLKWHQRCAEEAERVGNQELARFHIHAAEWIAWTLAQPTRKGFREED
jgi:hypothetical protein